MKKDNSRLDHKEEQIPGILVLGIGNFLLGDEGIGVHMIQYLEKKELPANVTLLDGGTGGFHLLSHLEKFPHIILIDATIDEKPVGSIEVLKPVFASDFPASLSAHEIGLKDLIETLYLLDKQPDITLVAISVKDIQPMSVELSGPVEQIKEDAARIILGIIDRISYPQS